MDDTFTEVPKPTDWPLNARECALENIYNALLSFIDNPGYKAKEILVSLVSQYDLNQKSYLGLFRITEYEVCMVNSLYLYSNITNLKTLTTYLYEIIGDTTQMQIQATRIMRDSSFGIEHYQHLHGPLGLYVSIYQQFCFQNNRSMSDQIIDSINEILSEKLTPACLFELKRSYVTMLNDLSYFRSKKRNGIWAFSHEELYKLFRLEAKLIKMNDASAITRPLKGVLMTTLSNFILKSRNSYNNEFIYKYTSKSMAECSIENHEIWLRKVKYLNDKRELKVLPELFANKQWLEYAWARTIEFKAKRDYYVSSFSKTHTDPRMNKQYGSCIYGYKNDRIAELLAPIRIQKNSEKQYPTFTQVVSFDVLYDRKVAKQEINFLCSIIDLFELTPIEKNKFLDGILQYWILSVKDKKWSYERERRYVLFLYDKYDYIEIDELDEQFLKIKTTLFILPDIVLGDNPVKLYLLSMIDNRRYALYAKPYMFCSDCFSCDFDAVFAEQHLCSICGSNNYHLVEKTRTN